MGTSSSGNLAGRNIRALLILGIALAAGYAVSSFHFDGLSEAGRLTFGVFTVAAILWMLEPFPLYVTSFIVVILEVVLLARDPVIVLLLGGFAMATAVKKYGLDEVISRRILRRVGNDPKIVLLGIMCTSALLPFRSSDHFLPMSAFEKPSSLVSPSHVTSGEWEHLSVHRQTLLQWEYSRTSVSR